jgi:Arc/MetJ-type ribon-helix-helix transcriptional regulator
MAENPQWKIRLDPYHRFVVRRFEKVYGSDRSDVIRTWVRAWVAEHQEQVRQAGASIEDWAQAPRDEGEQDD